MTEKQLAENICKGFGAILVDKMGGITLGGDTLGELYSDMFLKAGGYDSRQIYNCAQALRHWVDCAGYDADGHFVYRMSKSILNC